MKMPPLRIGDTIQTHSGPRKLYFRGQSAFFQKHQRRYPCRVIEVVDEPYTDGLGRHRHRQRILAAVIGH